MCCDDVMTSSSLLNVLCMAIDVAHDHVFVRKKTKGAGEVNLVSDFAGIHLLYEEYRTWLYW